MVLGFLVVIAILSALNVALTAGLLVKLLVPSEEQRNERKAEQAMADSAQREKDAMDEGFDNIMRFSVNGKTGFEIE